MEENKVSVNFIHNIIDDDLKEGKNGGSVYTRFPPEPNGYLHIGHAKSICLNFSTALKYGGKCNLRYDDTNPIKEDEEYVKSIEADVKWLGFNWDELHWASNYFDFFYESAIKLIKAGKAYVCDLNADEIRQYRGTLVEPGKDSPYRDRTVEENLKLFEEMKDGKYEDGSKVLRAKIDMASNNINMRDPVIYRISKTSHHNTKDKWCIYPMYDYAHPLEDAIEGITHSLCTLEFEDHRPLYNWVVENVGFDNPPRQIEFARLNLSRTIMSKRHLKKLVDDGLVDGWDDPRMPTISGLRRRGYRPEAIRTFCSEIGVSKANSLVDIAFLEHVVREDLKPIVESRNVIFDPIKVVITNYPEGEIEYVEMENSREDESLGSRKVPFGREIYVDGADFMEVPVKKYFRLFPGNEVRLKGAYFITCNEVIKDDSGKILQLNCTYDPETKSGSGFTGRKVKGTIHWVEASTAVSLNVNKFDYLMTEEGEFNSDSLEVEKCFGEPSLKDSSFEDRFQFFRHGYYIKNLEGDFNEIVNLKSSWKVKG